MKQTQSGGLECKYHRSISRTFLREKPSGSSHLHSTLSKHEKKKWVGVRRWASNRAKWHCIFSRICLMLQDVLCKAAIVRGEGPKGPALQSLKGIQFSEAKKALKKSFKKTTWVCAV